MPQIQGAEILDALSKIKEPATFNEIVRHVASSYTEPDERMGQLVQAALTAGVRYGFVQKHRDLYYAIKDAVKALKNDACSHEEDDNDNDNYYEDEDEHDIEEETKTEEMDSIVSTESTSTCTCHYHGHGRGHGHALVLAPTTPKLPKDGGITAPKLKDPNRCDSRHDPRPLKKHDSPTARHGEKKKDENAREYEDDEEEDDDDYSDDDKRHASTCPRDCAACAARKRAAASRRRKRNQGRSRSRKRRRSYKY